MALELYSGTQAVDTTEWSCSTDSAGPDVDTTPGKYVLTIDVSDMVAGDVLEVRVYEKARASDTQRQAHPTMVLVGAQSVLVQSTPEFTLLHGWDFTLKATAGTITVLWSIREVTAGASVSAVVATGGIAAASLAAAALNAISDALLDRNMATGTDSGTDSTAVRTLRQAVRVLRNKTTIAAGVATVTKEDDSTASWTAAVTTAAGNPITGVDPT